MVLRAWSRMVLVLVVINLGEVNEVFVLTSLVWDGVENVESWESVIASFWPLPAARNSSNKWLDCSHCWLSWWISASVASSTDLSQQLRLSISRHIHCSSVYLVKTYMCQGRIYLDCHFLISSTMHNHVTAGYCMCIFPKKLNCLSCPWKIFCHGVVYGRTLLQLPINDLADP